ncbi:MAG: AraC family ligand binding domain-containing protein, partial [Treponema sp.]|nr:AraC family ligand binding domain-containing protein [Treponema sp.]
MGQRRISGKSFTRAVNRPAGGGALNPSPAIKSMFADLEWFNEDECFYKKCYEFGTDKKALREFISAYDPRDLQRRKIILPNGLKPSIITEQSLFSARDQNVFLSKHNRYTPVFRHHHDYFESFFVLSGRCISRIEGESFTLPEGSLCFIAPGVKHTMEVFDGSIVLNICI